LWREVLQPHMTHWSPLDVGITLRVTDIALSHIV
jgi:hypothetical protein